MVDSVAKTHGEEWTEEHADLVLAQARLVGDIGVATGFSTNEE